MQKIILSIALILIYSFSFGQAKPNLVKDLNGNYTAISSAKDTVTAMPTGKTFTDSKGKVYPVFKSAKGKFFVNRISKSGNSYKYYLSE